MGKKPVIGLASLVVASLALSGCCWDRENTNPSGGCSCRNGTCTPSSGTTNGQPPQQQAYSPGTTWPNPLKSSRPADNMNQGVQQASWQNQAPGVFQQQPMPGAGVQPMPPGGMMPAPAPVPAPDPRLTGSQVRTDNFPPVQPAPLPPPAPVPPPVMPANWNNSGSEMNLPAPQPVGGGALAPPPPYSGLSQSRLPQPAPVLPQGYNDGQ